MKNSHIRRSKSRQRGLTLVELLVVLTIIATLAAIIYPAIVDSMKKSQAAVVADRLDAIEKAKVQYQLDVQSGTNPPTKDTDAVVFDSQLRKYLLRFGQQLQSQADLDQGTGGNFQLETWGGSPWFKPTDPGSNPYLAKYNVPTSVPSPTPSQ
ncbi:MAG TPA: prepilin-type N-terminal cleavage/methylation domain-containing protein [Chthoniobacterales bacterium]|nr:prepilin-type N-terminal cleavage/methylation domain-containing protein [Chthoniobacterales bacterium]